MNDLNRHKAETKSSFRLFLFCPALSSLTFRFWIERGFLFNDSHYAKERTNPLGLSSLLIWPTKYAGLLTPILTKSYTSL